MHRVMEMEAKPIPRATSSLPDSLMNSDAFEEILDRAFAIAESRAPGCQGTSRISAEELNEDVENCMTQSTTVDQQMKQLTLTVHHNDQTNCSQPVPASHAVSPVEYIPSRTDGLQCEVEYQPNNPETAQQHATPWPLYIPTPHGWAVQHHPGMPVADAQPQQNTPVPDFEEEGQLSAFISYINETEDSSVISDVLALETSLRAAGIYPRVDYREEELRGLNKNRWLEDCMENSSVIIICVNPSFKSVMRLYRSKLDDDTSNSETYFLMDLLETKYRNEACRNYKVLPLLIAGARFMDLPIWLQNTNVYRWPKDCEKLIQRILPLQD